MGGDVFIDTGIPGIFFDHQAYRLFGDRIVWAIDEKIVASFDIGLVFMVIGDQRSLEMGVFKKNDTLFIAFAVNA